MMKINSLYHAPVETAIIRYVHATNPKYHEVATVRESDSLILIKSFLIDSTSIIKRARKEVHDKYGFFFR